MKTMTCKQLGGAFELKFQANTFEEMADLSQNHGKDMFQKNDEAHNKVMKEMQKLMKDQDAMNKCLWIRKKSLKKYKKINK